jgi:hypothetical protein
MNSLRWYWKMATGVETWGDVVAVPKIAAHDVRHWVAGLILDYTPIGQEIAGDAVRGLAARVKGQHYSYRSEQSGLIRALLNHTRLGRSILSEAGYRAHLKRARAINADSYCYHHACAFENCPKGFHDDNEED